MFSLNELYDIKDFLLSLSYDFDFYKENCCEEAPQVAIKCLHKESVKLSKAILKVKKEIEEMESDSAEIPFS